MSAGTGSRRRSPRASPSSRPICAATATVPSPTAARIIPAYSFRAMGEDNAEVMSHFGFERFQVAGHDRGARVAFRMALDYPERVERLAALDIVPTYHVLTNVTLGWGLESLSLVLHGAEGAIPGKADLRRPRLLHRLQAQQEGRRAVDLPPGGDRRIQALHHAGADPCGLRGLSRDGHASISPWTRRTSRSGARSPARCWCCGVPTAIAAVISSRSRHGAPWAPDLQGFADADRPLSGRAAAGPRL